MSQKQKLLAAGAVLAVGFGLALLFRRPERDVVVAPPVLPTPTRAASLPATTSTPPEADAPSLDGQFSPLAPLAATSAGLTVPVDQTPAAPPDAAPIGPPEPPLEAASSEAAAPSEAALNGRPVYSPLDADSDAEGDAASPYRIHVVQNGDSLEKLAARYLSDGGRSLELFDLNRDVLDNPHLLEIGAELRIPIAASAEGD